MAERSEDKSAKRSFTSKNILNFIFWREATPRAFSFASRFLFRFAQAFSAKTNCGKNDQFVDHLVLSLSLNLDRFLSTGLSGLETERQNRIKRQETGSLTGFQAERGLACLWAPCPV